MHVYYIPGLVKRDISKSGISALLALIKYSKGSVINLCLVTLLPTPDAATLIQKRFKTEGLVRKCPFVFGPKQADTKGRTTPI